MNSYARFYLPKDPLARFTLLVLVFGVLLRFFITFFVHPAGDSYAHLSTARYIAQTNTLPLFEPIYRPFFYYPPFFHIITAGLYKLFWFFGNETATKAMDFVAPLFGSGSLIVFYLFAKKIVTKKVLFYSTSFLSFIPLHMYYSTVAHVDIAAAFMAILSVYLLSVQRTARGAIINGLGMMTKYTHLFIFPVIIWQIFGQAKHFSAWVRRSFVFFGITFLIGIPLYLRNYLYLGTPMWPFLNNIFVNLGMTPLLFETRPEASLTHFFDPMLLIRAYLDVFGVPLGLPQNLLSLPVPRFFLVFWLASTVIVLLPLLVGVFTKKHRDLTILSSIWIVSYAVMLAYYIYDFGDIFMRLVLPAFFPLALIWGVGLDSLLNKLSKRWRVLTAIVLVLIFTGFSGVEIAKAVIASQPYEKLASDFTWVQHNLPSNALFDRHSTYLIYHTQQKVASQLCNINDYNPDNLYHYSDPLVEPLGPNSTYTNWTKVYDNPQTKVKVLKKTPS